MRIFQSTDKILLTIHVSGFKFDEALDALTVKYGPSEISKTIIQNRAAASFDQIEATWIDGKEKLKLRKHAGIIDSPALTLDGERSLIEFMKKSKEKAIKNSENL